MNQGQQVQTIKPDDVVRTPTGRTAVCLDINADGSRKLEDVDTKEVFDMMPAKLYLVRSAPVRRWQIYHLP
jgi:hypothetical protein